MTDLEKLVIILEDNPYLDVMYPGDYEKAARDMISHGVTVKAMQKPLTVEELKRMEGSPVWCETEATKTPCVVKKSMIDNVDAIFYALGSEYPIFFNVDGYGQIWRCWAEKPTEEERKAAEWLC